MEMQNQYFPQSWPHPGSILSEKLMEMGMSSSEFSIRTGVAEKTIISINKGKSSITHDMALAFEKVTHMPAHMFTKHQANYDEFKAKAKQEKAIKAQKLWTKQFPIVDLVRLKWMPYCLKPKDDKTSALLKYFSVSSEKAWEKVYLKKQVNDAYGISKSTATSPEAISAWLRRGEIQAEEKAYATYFEDNKFTSYSEAKFKAALAKAKTIMATHPKDYFEQLQSICEQAGVRVVYTPNLSKAPINSCVRWHRNNPVIQLSGRFNRNDGFWLTFFRQAGHILLHSKKDVFIEFNKVDEKSWHKKEQEADAFAKSWILSKEQEAEVLKSNFKDGATIKSLAKKFNSHPGIILSRLQDLKKVPQHTNSELFEAIDLSEQEGHINEVICKQIESYAELGDNWDQDGAPAPTDKCIADAISFCKKMSKLNHSVYFTCPSLDGDIVVELQTRSKRGHLEFEFNPEETKFAKVLKKYFEQGYYDEESLPSLLKWLKDN